MIRQLTQLLVFVGILAVVTMTIACAVAFLLTTGS